MLTRSHKLKEKQKRKYEHSNDKIKPGQLKTLAFGS